MIDSVVVVGAAGAGIAAAGAAALVVRPTTKLAPRVRPYTIVARARLRGDADVVAIAPATGHVATSTIGRIFRPPIRAALAWIATLIERRDDAALELALRQGGYVGVTPAEYRTRIAVRSVSFAAAGAAAGALVLHASLVTVGLTAMGAVYGASQARGRLDRTIRERAERMRLELYTVNQLLAMHVRTGAGPIQAVQRVVDRGAGAVVDELAAVLVAVRRGAAEPDAFRHAAGITAEPAASRTYKLFAAGAERGVDLAGGLRALSEDLRDARREEIRQTATKRRAAMLVPTIAILAPVMLLFIAAPLPSVVFGAR